MHTVFAAPVVLPVAHRLPGAEALLARFDARLAGFAGVAVCCFDACRLNPYSGNVKHFFWFIKTIAKTQISSYSMITMEKNIYEFVIDGLQHAKGRWPAVAEGSGVPKRTIEKIARKETPNPGINHIQSLADYFHKQKQEA